MQFIVLVVVLVLAGAAFFYLKKSEKKKKETDTDLLREKTAQDFVNAKDISAQLLGIKFYRLYLGNLQTASVRR